MKITERRIVEQEWYETEIGWDCFGWYFSDCGNEQAICDGWWVVETLDTDKFGHPILGIAEKETEI